MSLHRYYKCIALVSASSLQVSDFCDTSVSGVYIVNNQCIYVIDTPMTYFDARLTCQQNGGDLLLLTSQADSDSIASQLQQVAPTARYWIGLTRRSWNWTDQESLSYTNWYTNQPSSPTLNCASINRNNDAGKWSSVDCTTPRFSICQKCKFNLSFATVVFKQTCRIISYSN